MKTISSSIGGPASATVTHSQVAALAYRLYLERGCETGHELDDWFRAEQLLRQGRGKGSAQTRQTPTPAPVRHSIHAKRPQPVA
jgi:hypothetical protein